MRNLVVAVIIFLACLCGHLRSAGAVSADRDGDGYSDALEVSLGTDPFDASSVPADLDGDLLPDVTDPDDDDDGVLDVRDPFPRDASEWTDTDLDGTGDNADVDDDDDGVADADDPFPLDAAETLDTDGDGIGDNADLDDDDDAHPDGRDAFPLDPSEWQDTDGDGSGDNIDEDDDGDGIADDEEVEDASDDGSAGEGTDEDASGDNGPAIEDNDGTAIDENDTALTGEDVYYSADQEAAGEGGCSMLPASATFVSLAVSLILNIVTLSAFRSRTARRLRRRPDRSPA